MRDEHFIRGSLPMTKSEVRAVSLSKLELTPGAVFWDVGAGTGSVTVEAARLLGQMGGAGGVSTYRSETDGDGVWEARPDGDGVWKARPDGDGVWEARPDGDGVWKARPDGGCAGGARAHAGAAVYAVEKEEEGIRLIRENKARLVPGFDAFHPIWGRAPEALYALPAPSHVFIGGSGGALRQIVEVVLEKNERARIVANVAALETLAQCMEIMEAFRFKEQEIVQVAAARVERMGRYHLQKAMNPVFVVTMQFPVYMGEKT